MADILEWVRIFLPISVPFALRVLWWLLQTTPVPETPTIIDAEFTVVNEEAEVFEGVDIYA